jgi:hypothetical protein
MIYSYFSLDFGQLKFHFLQIFEKFVSIDLYRKGIYKKTHSPKKEKSKHYTEVTAVLPAIHRCGLVDTLMTTQPQLLC